MAAVRKIFDAVHLKGRSVVGEEYVEGDIRVTIFRNVGGSLAGKVELGEHAYMVKRMIFPADDGYGFDEFQGTAVAKSLVKNLKGVRIVERQFGYQDEEHNSYFVSTWENLPRLWEYMLQLHGEEESALERRIEEIQHSLPQFPDVSSINMFYDKEKNEIVLYDLLIDSEWVKK